MDSVLRQSKAMCPFLQAASPATLRALSSSARPKPSPCGGTMSRLQVFAHRCPVMGEAMAVQSARNGVTMTGLRAFSGTAKSAKARMHTSSFHEARALDAPILNSRDEGEASCGGLIYGSWSFPRLYPSRMLTHPQDVLPVERPPLLANSTTRRSMTLNWTKSTRTSLTDTSTTSIDLQRNSLVHTWRKRKIALRSGVPMTTWEWVGTGTF